MPPGIHYHIKCSDPDTYNADKLGLSEPQASGALCCEKWYTQTLPVVSTDMAVGLMQLNVEPPGFVIYVSVPR